MNVHNSLCKCASFICTVDLFTWLLVHKNVTVRSTGVWKTWLMLYGVFYIVLVGHSIWSVFSRLRKVLENLWLHFYW